MLALTTTEQLLHKIGNQIQTAVEELENYNNTINHLASANSAASLNVNPDGSPHTFRTAVHGAERDSWKNAEDIEISRLLDTTTMHATALATLYVGLKSLVGLSNNIILLYIIYCTIYYTLYIALPNQQITICIPQDLER